MEKMSDRKDFIYAQNNVIGEINKFVNYKSGKMSDIITTLNKKQSLIDEMLNDIENLYSYYSTLEKNEIHYKEFLYNLNETIKGYREKQHK